MVELSTNRKEETDIDCQPNNEPDYSTADSFMGIFGFKRKGEGMSDKEITLQDGKMSGDVVEDASRPVSEWNEFSETMKEHIDEMGKKYALSADVQYYDIAPWQWALGDAGKYVIEVMRICGDSELASKPVPRQMMRENLLKAAHCLQIAFTKIES